MAAQGSNGGSSRKRRRPARARGPELLGALLADARAKAAASGEPGRIDTELWRRAVGPRIGERAAPGRLERGTLVVRVASAVWAQELSLLSDDIIGRLQAAGLAVHALRFRVERIEPAPRIAAAAPPTPPPAPLPDDLAERLARIDDPELRSAIADAASYSLALDAERERAASEPKRGARAPRSAGSGSDPPGRSAHEPRAGSRRRRGGRQD